MTRLPRITGKDLVRALQKVGFSIDRARGSHVFLKHPDGRATAVPVHSGETLGPGLLRSILCDTKLTTDDLTHTCFEPLIQSFWVPKSDL